MSGIVRRCGLWGFIGVLGVMLMVWGLTQKAWAAEKKKARSQRQESSARPQRQEAPAVLKSESPLHIASDRMEVSQTDKTILFEGHVTVQQDDLTITGSQMRVFAAQGDAGSPKPAEPTMMDQVDRIEVEGDVKISQRERIATAEKAVYYHKDQKIVLIGNPVVSQGQDSVRGRVITLYVKEGRSVIEGGDTPVTAVLHPSRKE